jgi:hypothetical protein
MKASRLQSAGAAFAALIGAAMSLHANAADASLPPEQRQGVASWVSGGIGESESHNFEVAFGRYPLVVQLFERAGGRDEYTADAAVRIVDAKGRVALQTQSDGPYLLVHLPAGEYRVVASLKGHELAGQRVRVTDGGHAKATFVFPRDAG